MTSIESLKGNVKFSVVTDNSTYAIFMHPDLLSAILSKQDSGGFAIMYSMNDFQSVSPAFGSFQSAFESMVNSIEREVQFAIESAHS